MPKLRKLTATACQVLRTYAASRARKSAAVCESPRRVNLSRNSGIGSSGLVSDR